MRRYCREELTRTNDLCVLPEFWKVPRITGNQVICASGISAFDEDIVGSDVIWPNPDGVMGRVRFLIS
jgi:hypothetical protein